VQAKVKIAVIAEFPIHVIPEFGEAYRYQGHYATWLPQLVTAFAAEPGLEIHWITLSRGITAPRSLVWYDQTFHVLPAAKKGCRAPTLYREDRHFIQECLREIQPDLVHGWGTEDVHAFAAAFSGYPNMISMQGILSHYVRKTLLGPRHYFHALLELVTLYKADLITVESEWGKKKLLRRNPAMQVEVVEYGVDDSFLETPWRPDPERPVALFVGSLVPPKGLQDLVAAFTDPTLAFAELWIAGDGHEPWAKGLRACSTPNIQWLGRCSRAETAERMSRAWCLALPTRVDTSPNVVKEARVIGLPVVTTPCGGQVTYVKEGKNGFLVAPGDVVGLRAVLRTLLSDFEQCRKMGAYRREEHRDILHPAKTARRFAALYRMAR
jgi:glycosyltransferase involved in cell wall biosynthesis